MLPWWFTAWEWVRKHAAWLGAGLLAILAFALGVSVKKRPVLSAGTSPEEKKAEDKVVAAEKVAVEKRDEDQREATKVYTRDVAELLAQEEKSVPALVTDTNATNDYLKAAGQEVRGGDGSK